MDRVKASTFAEMDPKSEHTGLRGPYPVRHILKIHVPKGHPGAYVAPHSQHPHEREFTLPPGTKMHIHHEPEYCDKTHSMVWHAKVLPHED